MNPMVLNFQVRKNPLKQQSQTISRYQHKGHPCNFPILCQAQTVSLCCYKLFCLKRSLEHTLKEYKMHKKVKEIIICIWFVCMILFLKHHTCHTEAKLHRTTSMRKVVNLFKLQKQDRVNHATFS